jgi:hypothetical protein
VILIFIWGSVASLFHFIILVLAMLTAIGWARRIRNTNKAREILS